ncbi:MAG TPA: glutamate racemase [Chlamydiales bacterium]|nr:MAG: glutamate racemase [Verrucomicrobia bacterium RIFCSPHIGHO2_12_FULL_41_10]HLB52335.1 glutamate racemase [Chlamydiales bacterium]
MAIGLFDSGLGGLTVLKKLLQLFPNETFIYLGDTEGLPYGNKSPEVIIARSLKNAEFLLQKKIKLLIIACFTASVHAHQKLQESLPIPVISMLPDNIGEFFPTSHPKNIALLGTASTIQSGAIQKLIKLQLPSTQILPISCPLFVPFIEEGLLHHPALHQMAEHYLSPVAGVDAAFLACTHYPLISPIIQKVLGPNTEILDGVSQSIAKVKKALSLLNTSPSPQENRFYVTADPLRFQQVSSQFFGSTIKHVELL